MAENNESSKIAPKTMAMAQESDWLAMAEAALRGQSVDSLTSHEADGLTRQPLYSEARNPTNHNPSGLPGFAPFMRGTQAVNNKFRAWHIARHITLGRDGAGNTDILADLDGGVSALMLDPNGQIFTPEILHDLLKNVMLDIVPIALMAGDNIDNAGTLLAFLDTHKSSKTSPKAEMSGFINHDPYPALLHNKSTAAPDISALFKRAAHHQNIGLLAANGYGWRGQGAGTAQEIGLALATMSQHLRDGEAANIAPDMALSRMTLTLAAETDFFVTIAKMRAARFVWHNFAKALGAKAAQIKPRLHAITDLRSFSDIDPWVNILRATTASMGAGIAGVDWLSVMPCSASSAADNDLTRRIARNTHIILQEESHIGHVSDAAGGSWYVEQLTRDVAAAAWQEFQKIEASGGLAKALRGTMLDDALAAQREAMAKQADNRAMPLIGVSEFPDIEAAPLPPSISPYASKQFRLAAPFEALRRAAQPAKPKVFQACIGKMADFSPRADFAANFYAAGGIHTIASTESTGGAGGTDVAAIADNFKKSGAKIAVICGTDADYETYAAPLAAALLEAGAIHLALAGQPRNIDGIAAYCFAGGAMLAFLQEVHARLGLETLETL